MKKEEIESVVSCVAEGLYERKEIVAQTLLALLAGESVFLYGPPGTAKSLIARRVSKVFATEEGDIRYFEYLMNRFSTPDEVFGPVSIAELKKDRYVRKTEGYLPEAHIAFLDEIWKAGPAILNSLLTIVNERKFRNDGKVQNAPLIGLVAASNEIPDAGQGLEALYDRFIMRLRVDPMSERENFENFLKAESVGEAISLKRNSRFAKAELAELGGCVEKASLSKEVLDVIHAVRVQLADAKIYVSDRRWKKGVKILKTAAVLCGRGEVLPVDAMLLSSILWSKPEEVEKVGEFVRRAVADNSPYQHAELDRLVDDLQQKEAAWKEMAYYAEDEYDRVIHEEGGGEFALQGVNSTYYGTITFKLPLDYLRHPVGKIEIKGSEPNGSAHKGVLKCHKTGEYGVTFDDCYGSSTAKFSIKLIHRVGESKAVDATTKKMYADVAAGLLSKAAGIEREIDVYLEKRKKDIDTPFVSEEGRTAVLQSLENCSTLAKKTKVRIKELKANIEGHHAE